MSTLEVEEKVDRWSMGEVVHWTKVQNELMASMKKEALTNSESVENLNEMELRQALDSLGSGDTCQMHGVLQDLIKACERIGPKNKWAKYDPNPFLEQLPEKTCIESAKDLFLYGDELVKALAVPRQKVWQNFKIYWKWKREGGELKLPIPLNELKMIQSLWFLQNWFVSLATANSSALLWAGFWDGDSSNRTTKIKLFEFAEDVDHQTVHPDTELGRLIEKHGDLNNCYNDPKLNKLANNMWSFASMSFVLGMHEKKQTTVVALLNKEIDGERPLKDSVLFRHEVPTVGFAAWGMDTWWSPQFLLIDMKGACHKTSQLLRNQLFTYLSSFKPTRETLWRDFTKKSELKWTCLDCPPGQCDLNKTLASEVSKIVKAQNSQCFCLSSTLYAPLA